ncbi:MAG: hypothetical protein WD607_07325 [Candidatus Paceibacterota bacterium]
MEFNIVISLLGALGLGAVISNIIDRLLEHKFHKKNFLFSELYKERAKIIGKVYRKISEVDRTFSSFMNPFQRAGELPKEEKAQIAVEAANDLTNYFHDHKIYFEKPLANKIEIFISDLKKSG